MSMDAGYDYIVVGGGSAGCVLASRLSEDPAARVLLVEAGRRDRSPLIAVPGMSFAIYADPRFNWGYVTEPQPGLACRSLPLTQARVLGGGSSINGMVYTRGAAHQYDRWAEMGATGWGYTDVLPYFRRSEASDRGDGPYHGTDGPIGVVRGRSPLPIVDRLLDALDQTGYPRIDDLNVPEPDGFGSFDWTVARGRRASTSASYPGIRRGRRSNLTVATGATVMRVVMEHHRAVGIELLDRGERRTVRAEREVVLCGGGIHSARLLLLSGVGPADALRTLGIDVAADLPRVGENLQNHVCYQLAFGISEPISAFRYRKPWTGAVEGLRYILARRGFLANGAAAAGGFFRSEAGLAMPDMQLFLVPALAQRADTARGRLPERDGFMLVINQGCPHSRGRVALRSADPFEAPIIDPAYLTDPRDMAALAGGAEHMLGLAEAPALKSLIDAQVTPGPEVKGREALEAHIRHNAFHHYHVAGTCRMGTDPLDSVTDPELRVHGVEALRVADGSVMPMLVNGNTNAPIVMIAERAADFIRGR